MIALVLAVGVGGCGDSLSSGGPDAGRRDADEASGKIFSAPTKSYSLEIPTGVVRVPVRKDESIPSKTDLSLELAGKVNAGGLIKTGRLSGPAAGGTFDDVAQEAARKYSRQYEGHPDLWGRGARVDTRSTTVGGRDAVEIAARFSPGGDPDPSIFFRIYFVDSPSGPPILVTCDWNTTATEAIAAACDELVASFKVNR